MSKIVVLGGCGQVGSFAVRTLAAMEGISGVVVGDIALDKAQALAAQIGSRKVTSLHVDALDPESVRKAITGSDVVLNCTGPFYKFVPTILRTVIQEKINYVDVCDDVDVTLEILGWDADAKAAGITALIGMGSSPGVTNLMARYAADQLLDEVDAVDIFHAHGGEPVEGEGVIGHRLHCMSIDIPMFLDGELKHVSFFREDGVALRQEVDFYRLGEKIRVYPYPHPEQVTIPRYIPARRVTNKGTVLPDKYFELIAQLCEAGLTSRTPLDVKGQSVSPYDFAVAYILRERERILKETRFGQQRGCVKVVVEGKKAGKKHTFVFSIASESQALGEGTGVPAALGAVLMAQGKISVKGVVPPEGCVNPVDFLGLIGQVLKPDASGKSFEGVLVESIDAQGRVEKMKM
jgi:saccharopine dehydrogenase (NAD+, L-lysine forming)